MDKEKQKSKQKKKTPGIPVKKDKGKKKPEIPVKVKGATLKEKIDKTVDDHTENPEELKKQIFGLVQRVLYPDQFCPDCGDRLFFGPNGWSCTNCGYAKQQLAPVQAQSQPQPQPTQPGQRPSETGKVPPQVDKVIKEAAEDMKEPRRVAAPTARGAKIRQLVDQRDTGSAKPTPEEEAAVRKDKNVSNKINWV